MDEIKVNNYLNQMPPQLIKAVSALSSKNRWAVYLALLERDQMYFSEIKDLFQAKPQTLTYILKDFTTAGLIHKVAKSPKDLGNKQRMFYKPTLLGENIIKSLISGALPKRALENTYDSVINAKKETKFTRSYDELKIKIPDQSKITPTYPGSNKIEILKSHESKISYPYKNWDAESHSKFRVMSPSLS
jgi:DNA-binding MarR family transcriptional regulator